MIRVLALTRWPRSAASSRQRFLVFSDYLARHGIEVAWLPFFDEAYIARVNSGLKVSVTELVGQYRRRLGELLKRGRYDLLWIEKEAVPQLPFGFEALLLRGSKILLDLDDAWHLRVRASPLRHLLRGKMQRLARRADAITVANTALRDWVIEKGVAASKVTLAPTGLDISHYDPTREPDGPFTLGWIGGPFTTEYLESIQAPLRRLSNEGVRLLVVGADRALGRLCGITIEQHPWSEATEASLIARCHVGISPLQDDGWSRFKSGYKLIQYMAAGRPSVASPIGANCDVVVAEETGLFATNDHEWYAQIDRLRRDTELRRRLGRQARQRCREKFSVEALGGNLSELMSRLAGRPSIR
ncbi:MAG: glycosyltransferase family 4 protein [Hyphomicrobiales bacterium]|nr:glycosyltransferase family 4 protein [Hyphomicrobiales bacterium]